METTVTARRTAAALWVLACLGAAGCGMLGRRADPATTGPKPRPIDPPSQEAVRAAIGRGVAFLVKRQNTNGSWGSSRDMGRGIYSPVPGGYVAFHTATTALCVMALSEAGSDRPGAAGALRRGEDWLLANVSKLRISSLDAMYNNWAHAYSIQALVRMLKSAQADPKRRERIRTLIKGQLARLKRYQHLDGGWGYYAFGHMPVRSSASSTSFTTATVLVALHEARQAGIPPAKTVTDRAVPALRAQRRPDFAYSYHHHLTKIGAIYPLTQPPGSLGRSQTCNAAMRLWGDNATTDAVIKTWLNRLLARNDWLSMARKQRFPHQGFYYIAAYFYYYGHYYAAVCIDLLPAEERPHFQDHLAHILLPKQEKDGSWWDFPFYNYHQQYGTAFAVMSLQRCLRPAETAAREP
jgi:hypothetical protein